MRSPIEKSGRLLGWAIFWASVFACSSTPKSVPELSRYEGKKVALVEIDGEPTAMKIVEVALINQLVRRGSFVLVSKQDIEKTREAHDLDPRDGNEIARRAGADIALRARVLEFKGDTHQGISKEKVYDEQLAAERGEAEGHTERLYKVRSLVGSVKIELEFTELSNGEIRKAIADQSETYSAEAKKSAAHLPPVLRFLERLSNEAFEKFFKTYE